MELDALDEGLYKEILCILDQAHDIELVMFYVGKIYCTTCWRRKDCAVCCTKVNNEEE